MEGFYDYDFYYVDVLPKGGRWNSIKKEADLIKQENANPTANRVQPQ